MIPANAAAKTMRTIIAAPKAPNGRWRVKRMAAAIHAGQRDDRANFMVLSLRVAPPPLGSSCSIVQIGIPETCSNDLTILKPLNDLNRFCLFHR
jgi:hypothetical protein